MRAAEPERGEALDDRDDAAQLLLGGHRRGAGARGLAADVDDRGALLDEPARVADGRRVVVERAAVGERVGRDVDHAHDLERRHARMDGNEPFTGWGSRTARVRDEPPPRHWRAPSAQDPAACETCLAMTTTEIRTHLDSLAEERAAALAWGADAIPAYLDDLEREIEDYRSAYVGAAVTEIATFRAQLSGPQVG